MSGRRQVPSQEEVAAEEISHRRVTRWPAIVALLAITLAYTGVSEGLAFVPRVAIPAAVLVGILLIWLALMRGGYFLVRPIALGLIAFITLTEAGSTLLLVSLLPRGSVAADVLLRDGAIIWGINVVTFALWYWEIDGGGPVARRMEPYKGTDFLFPQEARAAEGGSNSSSSSSRGKWSPEFIDYLFFLAFNHSTAFSPTDTAILSRRAKVLVK